MRIKVIDDLSPYLGLEMEVQSLTDYSVTCLHPYAGRDGYAHDCTIGAAFHVQWFEITNLTTEEIVGGLIHPSSDYRELVKDYLKNNSTNNFLEQCKIS